MMLAAVLRAKAEGLDPPGDVIFCALADEEAMGARARSGSCASTATCSRACATRSASSAASRPTRRARRFYPIQVAEKQVCTLRATVRGPGGHGSMPLRGGATARLGRMLEQLDRNGLPVHVTPVARQMLTAMAGHLPRAQAIVLRGLLRPALAAPCFRARAIAPACSAPPSTTPCHPTIIETPKKFNVIPSEIVATLDGRILPGFTPQDLVREVNALIGDDIELEVIHHDPYPAEPDLGLFATLAEFSSGRTRARSDPASDARGDRRAVLHAPRHPDLRLHAARAGSGFDFWSGVHGADERVPVEAVGFGADAIHSALGRFGEA